MARTVVRRLITATSSLAAIALGGCDALTRPEATPWARRLCAQTPRRRRGPAPQPVRSPASIAPVRTSLVPSRPPRGGVLQLAPGGGEPDPCQDQHAARPFRPEPHMPWNKLSRRPLICLTAASRAPLQSLSRTSEAPGQKAGGFSVPCVGCLAGERRSTNGNDFAARRV